MLARQVPDKKNFAPGGLPPKYINMCFGEDVNTCNVELSLLQSISLCEKPLENNVDVG